MRRLLLGLALMLSSASAHAWVSMDDNDVAPHTVWGSLPISYALNSAGCADIGGFTPTQTIVNDSFATWSEPVCTLWDTYYQGSTTRTPTRDGRNVIAWQESSWPHDSSAIGVCEVYFRTSHEIIEADIRMNGEDFTWNTTGTGGVDTQSICTHEMGHFLGLGDLYGSDCDLGQTMCGTYGGGRSKRTLTSDDISGVCTLYPTGCSSSSGCPAGFDCVGGTCVPMPSDVCSPCEYHAECGDSDDYCLSGFPDGNTYCGESCLTDPDCDWGYVCVTLTGGSERSCVPYNMSCDPPPTPECEFDTDCPERFSCIDMLCVGSLCAACTDNYDCGGPDDYCVSGFTDGGHYCGVRCVISADCPFGFQCIGVGGTHRQCVPIDNDCATPPERECTTDDDCEEGFYCELGYCYEAPECLTSDDCPEGEICVDDQCVPDPNPHLPMCAECTRHSECGESSDLCLGGFPDGTMRCGVSCESVGGDCGEGLICYELPDMPSQCIPASFDCSSYCTSNDDCPDGQHCDAGLCTDACDPADLASCPDGWYCDEDGCNEGHCAEAPAEPGTAALAEHCMEDAECESLRCEEVIAGSYCSERCDFLGDGACSWGMACQPLEGGTCGFCACSSGLLGDACAASSDCLNGVCAGICSMTCEDDSDCAGGYSCSEVSGYMLCMPAAGRMGDECESPEDCTSGLCATVEGYAFCTRACDSANCTCPSSYACREAAGGTMVCAMADMPDADQPSGCGCTVVGQGGGPLAAAVLLGSLLLLVGLLRRKH